ncbi:hypothetical protein [Xanthobacter flavus]|uniref:hypothetical protein n=1 Tax=Xanthobacter flavus TaxID=281 RepID=UPI00372CC259
MSDTDIAKAGLVRIAAHFPGSECALHELACSDPAFLDLCVEYQLALSSLAGFTARPDAAARPEVAEYRSIIAELETEIGGWLTAAGHCRRP